MLWDGELPEGGMQASAPPLRSVERCSWVLPAEKDTIMRSEDMV